MGEHDLARYIAASIDIRQARPAELINNDCSAIQLKVFEGLKALQISTTTDRDENLVTSQTSRTRRTRDGNCVAVDGLHLGGSEDIDAGFAVFIEEDLYHFGIEVGQDSRHGFDNRYRHTEFMVKRSELHADNTSTHDDDGFRQFRSRQCVGTIPNRRIVLYTGNRRHKVRRACTNHQVLCFVGLAVALNPPNLADIIKDFGKAVHHGTMLVIEALLDTGYEFAHDDGLTLLHGAKIKGHVLSRHTVFLRVRSIVILFGAVQERFGRNTTYVEAGTAYSVLLKEHYIFTGFGSLLCGGIARRAATYNG